MVPELTEDFDFVGIGLGVKGARAIGTDLGGCGCGGIGSDKYSKSAFACASICDARSIKGSF